MSAGGAPGVKGYLGVWNVTDGKLLMSQEMDAGTFYSLAMSVDGKKLALGSGGARTGDDVQRGYVLKMPEIK